MFFVNSIVSQLFRFLFTITALVSENIETIAALGYTSTFDASILTALFMGGLMYFITYLILSKKLNLE